jgi:hypothetical protein
MKRSVEFNKAWAAGYLQGKRGNQANTGQAGDQRPGKDRPLSELDLTNYLVCQRENEKHRRGIE